MYHVMREAARAGDQDHCILRVFAEDNHLAGHMGERTQQQKGSAAFRIAEIETGEFFGYLKNIPAQQRKAKGSFRDLGPAFSCRCGGLVVEGPQKRLSPSGAACHHLACQHDASGSIRQGYSGHCSVKVPGLDVPPAAMAEIDDPGAAALIGIFKHHRPVIPQLGFLGFARQKHRRLPCHCYV